MRTKEQLLNLIPKKYQERYLYLTDFFKYLPEAMVDEFHYYEVKKNEVIVPYGKSAETVYIMLDGEIKGMDYTKSGSMYTFLDFSKMHILGDFELFSNIPDYMISIRAVSDCKVLKIHGARYMQWIKNDENALYMRLTNVLKILTIERKVDRKFVLMGCKERVIDYLIMYCKNNKIDFNENVTLSLTQAELATIVGFNLRSVQRVIASLEGENLVTIKNRKMVISKEQYLKLLKKY